MQNWDLITLSYELPSRISPALSNCLSEGKMKELKVLPSVEHCCGVRVNIFTHRRAQTPTNQKRWQPRARVGPTCPGGPLVSEPGEVLRSWGRAGTWSCGPRKGRHWRWWWGGAVSIYHIAQVHFNILTTVPRPTC